MSSPNSPKKRILCVEDHVDTCELISTLLEQCGYEVASEHTFAGGLALARGQRPDLYLLDNRLPDGSGIDLCRQIRAFDPFTPVIFHSADAWASDREAALDAGAQEYITKPISLEDLDKAIARLLNEEECLSKAS